MVKATTVAACVVQLIGAATLTLNRMEDSSRSHELHGAVRLDGQAVVVGGLASDNAERLSLSTGRWTSMPSPHIARAFAGVALHAGRPMVVGGTDGQTDAFAESEVWEPSTNAWRSGPALNVPRNRLAAVAVGKATLAIGGMRGGQNTDVVEVIQAGSTLWRLGPPLRVARHGHAAVAVGQTVFVIGGYGPAPLRSVEAYDLDTGAWHPRAPMPTARGFLAAVVFRGAIYAIGGRLQGPAPVERYDPATDRWTVVGVLPFVRQRFAAVADEESIWLIGGEDSPHEVWRWRPE